MILFNFNVSPKCGGCRYLMMDWHDWQQAYGAVVIKCANLDTCNINPNRSVNIEESMKSKEFLRIIGESIDKGIKDGLKGA